MPTKDGATGSREQFWREQISLQLRSGLSQVEFCRQRGLVAGTLAWWKRQLKKRDGHRPAKSRFVPVRIVPRAIPPAAAFQVELRTGHRIGVPCPFDADALRRLVAILLREATVC